MDAENYTERLFKLKSHSFIAFQQSSIFRHLKNTSREVEFLIFCDFAVNELKHLSVVIISDYLTISHDTISVYEFQNIIVHFLKKNFLPKKVIYFKDI